ncbi:hypothetical protein QE152_g14039 [Popillia japonica]|uniref:Uncharacterized protein n=1 Tax=Popillia japonica TaxID=7064 RepID=A0AAW1LAP0_POPJA
MKEGVFKDFMEALNRAMFPDVLKELGHSVDFLEFADPLKNLQYRKNLFGSLNDTKSPPERKDIQRAAFVQHHKVGSLNDTKSPPERKDIQRAAFVQHHKAANCLITTRSRPGACKLLGLIYLGKECGGGDFKVLRSMYANALLL